MVTFSTTWSFDSNCLDHSETERPTDWTRTQTCLPAVAPHYTQPVKHWLVSCACSLVAFALTAVSCNDTIISSSMEATNNNSLTSLIPASFVKAHIWGKKRICPMCSTTCTALPWIYPGASNTRPRHTQTSIKHWIMGQI